MIDAKLFPYSGDLLVANAARGTYGQAYDSWSDVARTPRGRSDPELVSDLGEERHELPFRHPHPSLTCVAPLPIARQLGKHQVGFEWSEISRRYKINGITFHRVNGRWRGVDPERRQGTGPDLPAPAQRMLDAIQERNIANCIKDYEDALKIGASPEQARFLLPQSMEVVWVWTGSLLGWSNLVVRRSHPDTQLETREFVAQVDRILAPQFPHSWPALLGR
jgi:thymidylate synthase (FAD)